jgi:hypothetical protein
MDIVLPERTAFPPIRCGDGLSVMVGSGSDDPVSVSATSTTVHVIFSYRCLSPISSKPFIIIESICITSSFHTTLQFFYTAAPHFLTFFHFYRHGFAFVTGSSSNLRFVLYLLCGVPGVSATVGGNDATSTMQALITPSVTSTT